MRLLKRANCLTEDQRGRCHLYAPEYAHHVMSVEYQAYHILHMHPTVFILSAGTSAASSQLPQCMA